MNRLISPFLIVALAFGIFFVHPTKSYAALADNLVSCWSMDESGAGDDAVDSAGSNTLQSQNVVTYVTGKVGAGNAANYVAASTQYHRISDAAQTGLDITDNLSISLWFNMTTDTTNELIVSKWNNSGNRQYEMSYDTGNFRFSWSNTGGGGANEATKSAATTFSTATWYHLVVTFSGGQVIFYQDTSKTTASASAVTSIYNGTANFNIGSRDGVGPVDGKVDEVMIFNTVLSDADVATLYNSGNGISCNDILNPASPVIKSFKVEGGTIKTEGGTIRYE